MRVAAFVFAAVCATLAINVEAHDDVPAPPDARGANDYLSIAQARDAMREGTTSSLKLTQHFIARIAALDHAGPAVNSMIELNPAALDLARASDAQLSAGKDLPLLGIPIVLKDNIDTGDTMHTTAGSFALAAAPAPADATVVAKLREAGAVILGKTNLSEWANFRSTRASSGWSARGGQTRNPHVLDRSACGSSSGSGAAVAADFASGAIGTETDGSIVCPASMNGIVGIKPTLGLVSRAGVVPIASSQDTPGPMARSVADAARILSVIAGSDVRDPATAEADRHKTDYTRFLDKDGLKGKRIGVVRQFTGNEPNADRVFERALAYMKAAGATIVDPVEIANLSELSAREFTVLLAEFKHDIASYLATRPKESVKSLADLIAYNNANADKEMPWFGQELFLAAEASKGIEDPAYLKARDEARRLAGPEGIDLAMDAHRLDALVAPSWGPAFPIDPLLGDHVVSGDPTIGGASQPTSVAGYPSIAVPAGWSHGLPVGIIFFGRAWSEPTLIAVAHSFEEHTRAFAPPRFLATAPAHDPATDQLGVMKPLEERAAE